MAGLMKNAVKLFALSLVFLPFISCVSTRVYTRETSKFYDNGNLVAEKTNFTKDGKVTESSTMNYLSAEVDDMKVVAVKTSSSKKSYDVTKLQIFDGDLLYTEKEFREKDGVLVVEGENSEQKEISEVQAEKQKLIERAFEAIKNEEQNFSSEEESSRIKQVTDFENVTVESYPNGKYITYSILGKPFVILGSSAWSLLKCCGYALINFAGGYNAASGNTSGAFWMMPDTKKAKEKAKAARAANGISAYPEYHLTFTNNHIVVQKISSETENVFSSDKKEVKILAEETLEYDNTISIERSVSADAASTSATIGMVGTIITVPVSAITWVGGAAAGIYGQTQK